MKIIRYSDKGLVYYEFTSKNRDINLIAFKIRELILQLWDIYKIDFRVYLFEGTFSAN